MNEARKIIRALQAQHGFTSARALAAAAGIPQPTLSRFLAGQTASMEVSNFMALCLVFGVTLSELLGEVPLSSGAPAKELARAFADLDEAQQQQLLRIANALKPRAA